MVLNVKIEQARSEHDLFLPYTDGKGPISRLNLRRLNPERARKLFGVQRAEDNKMNRYINDLCREYGVNTKSNILNSDTVLEMLKNTSANF